MTNPLLYSNELHCTGWRPACQIDTLDAYTFFKTICTVLGLGDFQNKETRTWWQTHTQTTVHNPIKSLRTLGAFRLKSWRLPARWKAFGLRELLAVMALIDHFESTWATLLMGCLVLAMVFWLWPSALKFFLATHFFYFLPTILRLLWASQTIRKTKSLI